LRRNVFKGLPTGMLRIRWPTAAHLYDVRAGKYLGEAREWQGDLPQGGLTILARLPYRVEGLTATVEAPAVAPGTAAVVRATLKGGAPWARHAIHMDVARPDGTVAPVYALNQWTTDGTCRFTVPHALNDPAGVWRATVRDVLSGACGTASWRVAARP